MSATPRVEAVKHLSPHPEEAALLGGRLEGWIHGTRSRACPTSARRSPKSATADFGCSLPSFETRASKSAVADFDTFRLPKSGRPDFGARSSDCMSLPLRRRLTLDAVARVTRNGPGRASSKEGESWASIA